MKIKTKPKPPRPAMLWVDENGYVARLPSIGWRRVRYVPANRETAALRVAVRALSEITRYGKRSAPWYVAKGALTRIRKLTGGAK